MITRQQILHAFKAEKATTEIQADHTRYEAPKALKIGTAQKLLQGSWTYATYKDAWGGCYNYDHRE